MRIGSFDAEIYPLFEHFGENGVLRKPCKANACRAENEKPENALNGDNKGKWAGVCDTVITTETGLEGWLEVDLGEITPIYKWLVLHCGEFEDRNENTVDYFLQCKETEEEAWKTVDEVWGNREDLTLREFTPISARYVRLYIIRPTPRSDTTCRIFQFHVYRLPEQA